MSAYHTVGRLNRGAQIGAESSINKIIWSELDLRMHEIAMRILGAQGELTGQSDSEYNWLEGFLFAQAGPIYAVTNWPTYYPSSLSGKDIAHEMMHH